MKKLLISLFVMSVWLGGCASAATVKKDITNDLTAISQSGDCEQVCYALKLYIAQKLGGSIPVPPAPPQTPDQNQ